jgi:putative restriction endonuclease
MSGDPDDVLRAAANAYVSRLAATNGGVASWADLQRFEFGGRRIPLVGQTGIRKVAGLETALTILTTYRLRPQDRPYEDGIGLDNYPRYKWRGDNPMHADNRALRRAMELGKQLTWFEGIEPGMYLVHTGVWLVGEEPDQQQFVLALDETMKEQWQPEAFLSGVDSTLRRQYAQTVVNRRLHQPMFRRRVINAYRKRCALCQLRVEVLLEAAHIKEDADGGEPVVPNGIAMCSIHHRAFDRLVLGVRPDYVIQVRGDVLELVDGPTLQYALQGMHGQSLSTPRAESARPDPALWRNASSDSGRPARSQGHALRGRCSRRTTPLGARTRRLLVPRHGLSWERDAGASPPLPPHPPP